MGLLDIFHSVVQQDTAPKSAPRPMAPEKVMLILRGITGTFDGVAYPHGALDEKAAKQYAALRGYQGIVLDVSGETGPLSAQVLAALDLIHKDPDIVALYGFSGGGYNLRHILANLSREQRDRMELVVVLGAPNNVPGLYRYGKVELVYRKDPTHMDGPRALLGEEVSCRGE